MNRLKQKYMGLELNSPIVLSSSTFSMDLKHVEEAKKAGAGAIVMKSLFEEEIFNESNFLKEQSLGYFHTNDNDYINYIVKDEVIKKYTDQIKNIKKNIDIPVIASLNAVSLKEWGEYAVKIENAGADALELNIYIIPNSHEESSESIEKSYLEIFNVVKSKTKLPIALKLSPYFTNIYKMVKNFTTAGANGIVLFNRFYQTDIDLETLKLVGSNPLSSNQELSQVLRWIALLSKDIKNDYAATSGIKSGYDMLKAVLVGASVGEVASICYQYGIDYITKINEQMLFWLEKREIDSIQELKGHLSVQDESKKSFERFQYIKAIKDSLKS